MAKRGFGSPKFDREKQKEIASAGGRAAHERGTAHQWTPEEAREAGARGGRALKKEFERLKDLESRMEDAAKRLKGKGK